MSLSYLSSVACSYSHITRLSDLSLLVDSQVGWWIFHSSGSVNVLTPALTEQAEQILTTIEQLISSHSLSVLIISSAKSGSFIAGADLHSLFSLTSRDHKRIVELSQKGQKLADQIENLPIPVIAAINGACLGGGYELALACSHRLAHDSSRVSIGLPEVKVGLLPGSGGTLRLPKLIGIQKALQVIMTGEAFGASKALKFGLIDELLVGSEFQFFQGVRHMAGRLIGSKKQKRKNFQPNNWTDSVLEQWQIGQFFIQYKAASGLDQMTKANYPAPYYALDVIIQSTRVNQQQAAELESHAFASLAVSPESKALTSLFFLTTDAKQVKEKTNSVEIPKQLNKELTIGIIGAGVMGAQIAVILAQKGFKVYLRDLNEEIVNKGMKFVESAVMDRVTKKRMTGDKAKQIIANVKGGISIEGFRTCGLLIEAAVEIMAVKKKILSECESVIGANCVFATNTSSLSISELAAEAKRPEQVVGLHFFNPVSRMPLIEVIRGNKTSDYSTAICYQLSLDLGKFPVICKDGPGFIVNRILGIYMNEAGLFAMEGKQIQTVDKALCKFGMPMGPFQLMDEVGLDVAAHVGPILEKGLGQRFAQIPAFAAILKENPTALGKKTGKGFYIYDAKGKNEGLNTVINDKLKVAVKENQSKLPKSLPKLSGSALEQELIDRCVLLMINEAVGILDERIVATPGELDLAMIMGTGFAPFRGGLLSYADFIGIQAVVDKLKHLEQIHGLRFTPHPALVKMVQEKKRFFPDRPDPKSLISVGKPPRSKL
jgi:3-hydroxyacyl-CoA dehydrogenase/enoyl-CoA hydratase/3-hydroxybutyryl-CoA epimerase